MFFNFSFVLLFETYSIYIGALLSQDKTFKILPPLCSCIQNKNKINWTNCLNWTGWYEKSSFPPSWSLTLYNSLTIIFVIYWLCIVLCEVFGLLVLYYVNLWGTSLIKMSQNTINAKLVWPFTNLFKILVS